MTLSMSAFLYNQPHLRCSAPRAPQLRFPLSLNYSGLRPICFRWRTGMSALLYFQWLCRSADIAFLHPGKHLVAGAPGKREDGEGRVLVRIADKRSAVDDEDIVAVPELAE